MSSCEHELKTRRGKSREVSSRFLSPSASSSPNRRISTSAKIDDQNNNRLKENYKPSPWIDDVILPGRFSVDECALYRRRNSCSLLYDSYNDESDSEQSDVSFSSLSHKPGIKVSSKYLHRKVSSQSNNNVTKLRSHEGSVKGYSFSGISPVARYGSSMSQWALAPGRSLETQAMNLKPPRSKAVGKLFNLGFDFFRSKKKSSPFSSPLKPKTCDAEAVHQLKLMNNRLVQWRFVNARASAANNNVASREKKQLVCACDTLTKLKCLVVHERIKLQKKTLEMKLDHVLLKQVKQLEAWEDMEIQHLSSLSMTSQALHSVLSRLPLREGAKVKIESAATSLQKLEAVADAIISTVNSFSPTMEDIVPLAFQLAQVAAQEKLMLEQCHDLLRMISEFEMQEMSIKCCFLIQHKQTK